MGNRLEVAKKRAVRNKISNNRLLNDSDMVLSKEMKEMDKIYSKQFRENLIKAMELMRN